MDAGDDAGEFFLRAAAEGDDDAPAYDRIELAGFVGEDCVERNGQGDIAIKDGHRGWEIRAAEGLAGARIQPRTRSPSRLGVALGQRHSQVLHHHLQVEPGFFFWRGSRSR